MNDDEIKEEGFMQDAARPNSYISKHTVLRSSLDVRWASFVSLTHYAALLGLQVKQLYGIFVYSRWYVEW
jgi:hypothetical protein